MAFLTVGKSRKCPLCGFQYEIGQATEQREPSDAITVFGALLRVFLIMVAIAVVAIGVLFIGCATVLKF